MNKKNKIFYKLNFVIKLSNTAVNFINTSFILKKFFDHNFLIYQFNINNTKNK